MKVCIDIIEVFHKANLVSISTEQGEKLLVVHAPKDGAFADLKPVEMEDGKNCTRLLGVDVFDAVPRAVHCQKYSCNRRK